MYKPKLHDVYEVTYLVGKLEFYFYVVAKNLEEAKKKTELITYKINAMKNVKSIELSNKIYI